MGTAPPPKGPGGLQPAPKPTATPSSAAPATPRPAATAPPTAAAAPAPAAATPMPTPGPNPALASLAAGLRTAPYVGRLLDVLAHPVAATRPDLRHFSPATDGATPDPAAPELGAMAPATGSARGHGGGRGVVVLEVLFAAIAASASLRLRRLLLRPWSRRLLALGLFALLLPASTATTPAPAPQPEHPAAPPVTAATPATAPPGASPPPVAASTPWSRLLDIEVRLGAEGATIAQQEWDIRRLATIAGRHVDDADQVTVGAASIVAQRARLATLLAAHDTVTAAYHGDLEAEYALYRSAAADPGQRAALTAAAAHFPTADAPVAVHANLELVATQLAQEAALTDAQERLRRLEALLPAQVAAIRHRKPFITPEVAEVSQVFGPTDLGIEPPLTYDGTFYPHFHTGLDLAGPDQTPLHAAADGVVLIAAASTDTSGRLVGYGNYVVIGHAAGFLTLYGHMSQVAVHAGDRVRQGQVIGFEGSTGNSTGPHVHFEIRRNDTLLDPAPFLAGQLPATPSP